MDTTALACAGAVEDVEQDPLSLDVQAIDLGLVLDVRPLPRFERPLQVNVREAGSS